MNEMNEIREQRIMNLEINGSFVKANDTFKTPNGGTISITPPLDKEYWAMRIPLSDKQAIVCFPKFFTVGIGFQIENADWNTNLPYSSPAKEIFEHIKCNKGDESISDEDCMRAIELLQEAIKKWRNDK